MNFPPLVNLMFNKGPYLCIGGKLRKWTTRLLRYQGAWVTRVCRDAILSSRIKFSVAIVCVRVTFGVGVFAAAAIPFLGSSDSSGCLAGSSTARLWWWISWFRRLFFEDAIALDSTRLAVYTREDFIALDGRRGQYKVSRTAGRLDPRRTFCFLLWHSVHAYLNRWGVTDWSIFVISPLLALQDSLSNCLCRDSYGKSRRKDGENDREIVAKVIYT